MTIPADPLPNVLNEIALIAGEDAARKVAAERGGTRVYLPPNPGPDHWLTKLVGLELALEIADHFTCGVGGMRLDIPLGEAGFFAQQKARCDHMILAGRSERDIARACGYTERGVRKRKARLRQLRDDRQGDLFQG